MLLPLILILVSAVVFLGTFPTRGDPRDAVDPKLFRPPPDH